MLATEFPKIDVAAAYQHVLEVVAARLRRALHAARPGIKQPRAVGGVVANVKLNQRLQEIPGVEGIFIHPNMGDGGCGTGAALLEFVGRNGAARRRSPTSISGPSFSRRADRRGARTARSCRSTDYTPIEPKIAALHRRRQGRRPLRRPHGIRPARARQPVDPLPRQGAGGEPVAEPAARPHRVHAVRAGDARTSTAHECYRNVDGGEYAAQFMTLTFDCTERMKRDSPAAVHVDGTARPQLVTATSNPSFHRILTRVSPADRHSVGDQHELQHARGADRLLARTTRSGRSCRGTWTTSRSATSSSRTRRAGTDDASAGDLGPVAPGRGGDRRRWPRHRGGHRGERGAGRRRRRRAPVRVCRSRRFARA